MKMYLSPDEFKRIRNECADVISHAEKYLAGKDKYGNEIPMQFLCEVKDLLERLAVEKNNAEISIRSLKNSSKKDEYIQIRDVLSQLYDKTSELYEEILKNRGLLCFA